MTLLDQLIDFWRNHLELYSEDLSLLRRNAIELTIKALEELKELKEE